MTKTVTIDVPIEVRKTGPDKYEYTLADGLWFGTYSEASARRYAEDGSPGARAIVQAIDSGAFVDPLPTAEGAHVYNHESNVHFFRTDTAHRCWGSSRMFKGLLWHTPELVQSYGPFEVLYDPEAKS